eukprot:GHVR01055669.1.p1 GENE.GHVR01055669.1~~GHVR01055669.1.p1  ORF type:complete len:154 (-),score=43.96 GHVR01055669.1:176-637(-)
MHTHKHCRVGHTMILRAGRTRAQSDMPFIHTHTYKDTQRHTSHTRAKSTGTAKTSAEPTASPTCTPPANTHTHTNARTATDAYSYPIHIHQTNAHTSFTRTHATPTHTHTKNKHRYQIGAKDTGRFHIFFSNGLCDHSSSCRNMESEGLSHNG